MRRWFLVFGCLLALGGCKGTGIVCQNSGSTSECGREHICTFTAVPVPFNPNAPPAPPLSVCLRTCNQATDCGEGELCEVVFCSTQKSCQTGVLDDPPPGICDWLGEGGSGGSGGAAGAGGMAGMGGGAGGSGGMDTRDCNSTAVAFIKTLDPNANFNLTNLVEQDTTDLPDTWERYSIELEVDAGLEGQILQIGFAATATNFEPSGVFYDNLVVDPNGQYTQNFEGLDIASPTALSDDDWVVFGNAFEADGETLAYGYGPNPAPNPGEGFCAVAANQGGPDQGTQQLSIYSDYANQDQGIGRRIEANTFRERTIEAADVGTTIVFSFDAKRGNINEGCP